jgi:hypothetical protein
MTTCTKNSKIKVVMGGMTKGGHNQGGGGITKGGHNID